VSGAERGAVYLEPGALPEFWRRRRRLYSGRRSRGRGAEEAVGGGAGRGSHIRDDSRQCAESWWEDEWLYGTESASAGECNPASAGGRQGRGACDQLCGSTRNGDEAGGSD